MVKNQIRGKYVPDKDGKLRPVLKLIEMKVDLPVSSSHNPFSPVLSPAWYSRAWLWLKNKIF